MILFVPTICIVLFLCLSIYSISLYPGSSQHDIQSKGFSWQHNYWCDILDKENYAGEPNDAYVWGIGATLLLCVGTGVLFYQFPIYFESSSTQFWIISSFGILSMIVSVLIFTPLHNQAIGIASIFGLIALLAMFMVLYQNQKWFLFYYGIFTCLILLFNNYIYYTKRGIRHLPWIQKISIAIVLVWIVLINILGVQE